MDEVHKSKFYKQLKKKGIDLADNEILAVYIYTVNDEFADIMQKGMKIPCKWKQTFYYFVRGILKIYDAEVFNKDRLPKRLYHGAFGQSKISVPFHILSPWNCTAKEDIAKNLAAPPDGTMFVLENCSVPLSEGKLIAAPISWISPNPEEEEWVILPFTVLKIGKSKTFSVEKECREITIKKYQTFNANLYGVDIFGKLADLQFVKSLHDKL